MTNNLPYDFSKDKYEKKILNQEYELCLDCNQPNTFWDWCKDCNSKRFQNDFKNWTSGNELLDQMIQESQLKARNSHEVLEWIPYDKLRNIQYLARGGFSTIYKAIWLNGFIHHWDKETNQWYRYFEEFDDKDYKNSENNDVKNPLKVYEKKGYYIALKSLENSSKINETILIEVKYLFNFF